MSEIQSKIASKLPSFSIILETENLSTAELEGFYQSIDSLIEQNPSAATANEVLIVDSGDTPPEVLQSICDRYPWITIHHAPPGIGYYEAKMEGSRVATGEIILFCDSDCVYEPNWLNYILSPFVNRPEINIIAGETATKSEGIYGLAMHLSYIFTGFSGQEELVPAKEYYCNNVSFRRNFLLQHPIPSDMSMYRGNCSVHARALARQGYYTWRQPKARAKHAPPNGLEHFFWRFLLIGYDQVKRKQLFAELNNSLPPTNQQEKKSISWLSWLGNKVPILRRIKRAKLSQLIYLPLALPIMFASWLLVTGGFMITKISPNYLLRVYSEMEGTTYESLNEPPKQQLIQAGLVKS